MLTPDLSAILERSLRGGARAFGADDVIKRLLAEVEARKTRSERLGQAALVCFAVVAAGLIFVLAEPAIVPLPRPAVFGGVAGLSLLAGAVFLSRFRHFVREREQAVLLLGLGANLPPDDATAVFQSLLRPAS